MKVKVVSFLLFMLFGAFAWLQHNDPDPLVWVSIYGSVAVFSLFRVFGVFHRSTLLVLLIVMFIYSLVLIPGVIEWLVQPDKGRLFGPMTDATPWLEETREFLGLVMALLALFYHFKNPTVGKEYPVV